MISVFYHFFLPLFFLGGAWIAAFRTGLFALAANLAAAFLAGLFLALGLFIAFLGAGAGAFFPGFFLS